MIRRYKVGYSGETRLSDEQAMDEIAADYTLRFLEDTSLFKDFVKESQEHRSWGQKLLDSMKALLAKIRRKFRSAKAADEAMVAATGKTVSQVEKALELWEKALAETREAVQRSDRRIRPEEAQKTTAQSGGKMSLDLDNTTKAYNYSKPFAQQVEDWINGKIPSRDSLVVSETPGVWKLIGLNALPVTINQTHIDYAINGTKDADHFLTKQGLLQLPEAIKHPVAIISSKTKNGTSLVAMLDIRQNGKQVIVPVVIDGFAQQNNLLIDSNAITSAYGKNYSISNVLYNALNDEANGKAFSAYYVDIGKATALLQKARVPMPKGSAISANGFVHSIDEVGSPVNKKFSSQTETQQFKRWFGKSKVVDEDGKPLVVYHGTDAEFFEFDMGKGRANMDIQGAFFSPYEIDAGGYGKNVGSYYLSIKNPADESTAYRALSRFKGQNNAGVKAREYLIQQGYDGVYNGYDEYIAFYPEQIKSATDNIGTFDGSNPDIRYSLEATEGILEEELELAQLRRSTVDRLQYLRKQVAVTKDATADPKSVERIAKKLITRYGVEMDADDLAGKLQVLYDRVLRKNYLGTTLTKREKSVTMVSS